jgi:hypothetical protein
MDHIFDDTHEIAFGSTKQPSPSHTWENLTTWRKIAHDDFTDLHPDTRSHHTTMSPQGRSSIVRPQAPSRRVHSPQPPTRSMQDTAPEPIALPSLTRLIEGMKSSFLPREEDSSVMRMIALSSPTVQDPLFMVTRDDTTVLIGSGFGSMNRAGADYTTFPDMRLIYSERSRLSAWILLDARIDPRPFQTILPSIGFPPIYATRDIIAKFRNTITDTEFLSQCRFFELFTDGMIERRIGDIEYRIGKTLIMKSGDIEIWFSQYPLGWTAWVSEILIQQDAYIFAKQSFVPGEIMMIQGDRVQKHSMRFTFDTFFVDKNSIGITAWYTLTDREQLAENGVLIFTLEEDTRARTIAGHIFIDSRGFVHAHEMMSVHKEILKWIRSTYEKLIVENPKIDRGSLVQGLRRELTKYCYLLTGRTPVVMPILIER